MKVLFPCEYQLFKINVNTLSANPTKWPNTLRQFVGNLPTNCLSVFDHFVKLALKGLRKFLYPFGASKDFPMAVKTCAKRFKESQRRVWKNTPSPIWLHRWKKGRGQGKGHVRKRGWIVNIPIVSYFFVIRFVSITYWKS